MAYLPLSTANLPDPAIDPAQGSSPQDYFGIDTYAGTGTTHERSELQFQPDFVWTKNRTGTNDHQLVDAVRGNTKALRSNGTDSEDTFTNGILSFDSDGVTLGSNSRYNATGNNYVSWNWKANGSGSTIAAGSIDGTNPTIASDVSANTESGFSIVSYTGNGTSGATVGHGLSSAPDMIIVKIRSGFSGGTNWRVYHSALGATQNLRLNTTDAAVVETNKWNDTAPTSSVFSLGNHVSVNENNATAIAYCFHSVEGFSKVGSSYTGNGSTDGTFVYTGFRPSFVMLKRSDSTGTWQIWDTKRDSVNFMDRWLTADGSGSEGDGSAAGGYIIDSLSNGFKLREDNAYTNASGGTYIYMAFAENPFKYSNAR